MKINQITVSLEDWFNREPSGAIAYDGATAACSEYCETVEEFKQFFSSVKEKMGPSVRLIINLDAFDLCDRTEAIVGLAHEIRDAFLAVIGEEEVSYEY